MDERHDQDLQGRFHQPLLRRIRLGNRKALLDGVAALGVVGQPVFDHQGREGGGA
jgi:hypothetical protein